MGIEKTDDEIIIRVSAGVNLDIIQRSLDYIRYVEITSKSKATQEDADKLAKQSKKEWWAKNGATYLPKASK